MQTAFSLFSGAVRPIDPLGKRVVTWFPPRAPGGFHTFQANSHTWARSTCWHRLVDLTARPDRAAMRLGFLVDLPGRGSTGERRSLMN